MLGARPGGPSPGGAPFSMEKVGSPEIAERLRELAGYLRLTGQSPWKAKAYDTAAGAVEALGGSLAGLVESGRLTETPGIGDSLAAVITELHETGTSRRLE